MRDGFKNLKCREKKQKLFDCVKKTYISALKLFPRFCKVAKLKKSRVSEKIDAFSIYSNNGTFSISLKP